MIHLKISNLVKEQTINLNLLATTKEDVFYEMSGLLVESGIIKNQKKFVKDLFKREKECSTGIGDGFAIPHAKSKQVTRATLAIGCSHGIKDYETLDGSVVKWIFMIAVPESNHDVHLDILSSLARKMMDDEFKGHIASVKQPVELIEILSK
jgi:fructose-specific phosphotransferase system IIA component